MRNAGILLQKESMAVHTSWRVGGVADCYYQPGDVDDLQRFLKQLGPQEPLIYLGLCSNVLVRDGGIRGTVIATQACLAQLKQVDDLTIYAEAGVSCAQLARYCARL